MGAVASEKREQRILERVKDISPEGAPPPPSVLRREGRWAVGVLGLAVLGAAVVGFVFGGPAVGVGMTLTAVLAYLLGAAPAWYAAMARRREMREAIQSQGR